MSLNSRLESYFEAHGARYEISPHPDAYTAQGIAAASHVPGREVVKVLVLTDGEGGHIMLAVPAPVRVDLAAAEAATGHKGLRLTDEDEMTELFPDCALGAMPPFGHVYDMPLYVDGCLRKVREVHFQAGSHRELVAMTYSEYLRLARPAASGLCFHRELHRHSA